MKTKIVLMLCAAVISVMAALVNYGTTFSQSPSITQFQININTAVHQTYGLYYPVTYIFQVPSGSSDLTAQFRYDPTDNWITLTTMTSSDFFNGINAARFDYPNNKAYISVAFSPNSDYIYVRVLHGQTEVNLSYLGMPVYYDNRHAAVTVTLDDWDNRSGNFDAASRYLTAARVHFSVGINSGLNPDWALIQNWYNQGYLEPAGHTRTHPCYDDGYLEQGGYDWQIAGVRDDILANLALNHPYVPAFFDPCGFESVQVRQAVVAAHYITDRGWNFPRIVQNTFAPWVQDGAYERSSYSYDTYYWTDPGTSALTDEANAAFNTAYASGGIYHIVDHPWQDHWRDNYYLLPHITYISNRPDVWYAAFGELYLYHYVQEKGKITVDPAGTLPFAQLPQTGWSLLYADSQETLGENGVAVNAFDGNVNTIWHTQWLGATPPLPHEIQINLGLPYAIDGFRYLPRQDGGVNGTITQYEFYVSADGVNWGTPVATGTFTHDLLVKEIRFAATTGQFVRLRALSEYNGNPWTSAAEINVSGRPTGGQPIPTNTPTPTPTPTVTSTITLTHTVTLIATNTPTSTSISTNTSTLTMTNTPTPTPTPTLTPTPTSTHTVTPTVSNTPTYTSTSTNTSTSTPTSTPTPAVTPTPGGPSTVIPQTGWSLLYADSQETLGENGVAVNAFDGNVNTIWHTQWLGATPPLPHEIQINLGLPYAIDGFRYLPRQDGGVNGTITQYEFYVSADGVNWGTPVATGTFTHDLLVKEIRFAATTGQFVRLRALSEYNGNPWTSAAEINVIGN